MSRIPLNHLLKIGADALQTTSQTLSGAVNELKTAIANISQSFSGLTDVDIDDDTLAEGQVPRYNDVTGKWENQNLPQGGHIMLPVPSSLLTASQLVAQVSGALNTNENVNSLWGTKVWSNCDVITLFTTLAQGHDTIGVWEDNWKETTTRTGWIFHECLKGILSDDSVEISEVYDVRTEEAMSVLGWRIDDDVTYNGVSGGAAAIKFNYPAQSEGGVRVGIKLTRQRTQSIDVSTIS